MDPRPGGPTGDALADLLELLGSGGLQMTDKLETRCGNCASKLRVKFELKKLIENRRIRARCGRCGTIITWSLSRTDTKP